MAPLNPEPADPSERQAHHLPPKSYAEAAEEGFPNDERYIDEDAIKETPPRNERRSLSEPRAYGEFLDDQQSQDQLPSTPTRVQRKPVPDRSYADAAAEHLTKPHARFNLDGKVDQEPESEPQELTGQGSAESPRSPRRVHKRHSSKAMNGERKDDKDEKEQGAKSVDEGTQNKLVYEKFGNGDGESLTSVKPADGYEEGLRQDKVEDSRRRKTELASGRTAGSGWDRSAIRWAPLNVPLQRRLQTLMVLVHTLSIAGFLTIFFFLCAIPILWPILIPYLIYVLFSRAGASGTLQHRSERLRRLPIWSLFASYFPARLHRSRELPPTRKYIFGYHPHGIISHGAFAAFGTEALGFGQLFPGITNTLLTLDSNFRIPLYRDYALRLGLGSVSRESCENILSKGGPNGEGMGRAITIVVGGARESLDAQPDHLRLVLKRRKGFVKLAIRTGADLVPVLAFGENELYEQFDPTAHPNIHKFQLMVKKFLGFTIPLFHARGVFNYDAGLMPYRRPLNIVVGRPIMIERQERPDEAYVDEIHEMYTKELVTLWDEWKDIFAKGRKGELEIVE